MDDKFDISRDFDQAIREHESVQPVEESVERLATRWGSFWKARVQRRRRLMGASVLSGVVLVAMVGVTQLLRVSSESARPDVAADATGPRDSRLQSNAAAPAAAVGPEIASPPRTEVKRIDPAVNLQSPVELLATHEADALERGLFAVQQKRRKSRHTDAHLKAIDDALAVLTDDPEVDTACLLEEIGLEATLVERAVIGKLRLAQRKMSQKTRIATLRLLEQVGSERSIPWLVALGHDFSLRGEVIRTLSKMEIGDALRQWVWAADRGTQVWLLQVYLVRGDEAAIDAYLEFVHAGATRPSALAAMDGMPDPPVRQLMALLSSGHAGQRYSAAVALAQCDRPDVVGALVYLTRRPTSRAGALAALMVSQSPQATRFCQAASRDAQSLIV
ncbi:MAG: hypothetical protein KDA60_19425, partial [Planctomycetales bacterium]|nr:hypothetical protein [Planctomycetales bacterium]